MFDLTLANIQSIFKKSRLLIAILILSLAIVGVFLAAFLKPGGKEKLPPLGKLPKLEMNQTILAPGIRPRTLSKIPDTNLNVLPKEGRVFRLKVPPTEKEIEVLAKKLGLTRRRGTTPEGELIFEGESGILFYSLKEGGVRFNLKNIKKPSGIKKKSTEEELVEKAKQFIINLGFYTNADELLVIDKKYSIIAGMEFGSVSNLNQADFLSLGLTKTLDKNPILYQTSTLAPTSVKTSVAGEVVLFEHVFIQEEGGVVYQFKTQEEILKSLAAGEGFVLKIAEKGKEPIELLRPYRLGSIEGEQISFSYFKDNSFSNLLQPVFKIEGKARLEKGEQAQITLILPAVSTSLISSP